MDPHGDPPAGTPGRRSWPILIWAGSGVLAILLVAGLVLRLWPRLHPGAVALARSDPSCDLRLGDCLAVFQDDARVTFGILPRSLPLMIPLQLDVRIAGLEPSEVEVDFVGVDMNMGFNRAKLTPLGDGLYRGRGMLPVCVRARMTWEARVLLRTTQGVMAAPFRFETRR